MTTKAREREAPDLAERMRERVQHHMEARVNRRDRVRNPAIPNNPFDFHGTGLPSEFTYHPVEVPNESSPNFQGQVSILNDYLWCGFQFLTDDMVTKDGRNGTAMLPDFVAIDHRVVVAGCYILYASKDWYEESRRQNVASRNAILEEHKDAREEELDRIGGNRSVRAIEAEQQDVTNEMLDREEGVGDEDD